jgi:hypothetical protein
MRDDAAALVPRLIAVMDLPADRSTRKRNHEHVLEALGQLGPAAKAAIPRLRLWAEDNDASTAAAAQEALAKVERK